MAVRLPVAILIVVVAIAIAGGMVVMAHRTTEWGVRGGKSYSSLASCQPPLKGSFHNFIKSCPFAWSLRG